MSDANFALPPTAHIDLSSMAYMPLMIREFVASRLVNGVKSIYSINNMALCASAFQQVPAGSIPDDDIEIATMSGFRGSDEEFQKAKPVILRGFTKYPDNRWYHPFVIRKAIEIWDKNEQQRERYRNQTEKANEARRRAAAERRAMRGGAAVVDERVHQDRHADDRYDDYRPRPSPVPDMEPIYTATPREAAGASAFRGFGASAHAHSSSGEMNGHVNGRVCDIDGQSIDGDVTYADDDLDAEISARDGAHQQDESRNGTLVPAAEKEAWTEENEENQPLNPEQRAAAEPDRDVVCDNECNVIVEDPNININLIKKVSKKESPYSPPRGDDTEVTLFGDKDQAKGQGREDGRIEVSQKPGPSVPSQQKTGRSRRPSMPLSDELEQLWSVFKTCYPPRLGNMGWAKAKDYFVENIRRGHGGDVMIRAAQCYYQNMVDDGKVSPQDAVKPVRTEFVMQASSFLSPSKALWQEAVEDFEQRKLIKASGGTVTRINAQRPAGNGSGKPFHRPEPPRTTQRGPWA